MGWREGIIKDLQEGREISLIWWCDDYQLDIWQGFLDTTRLRIRELNPETQHILNDWEPKTLSEVANILKDLDWPEDIIY